MTHTHHEHHDHHHPHREHHHASAHHQLDHILHAAQHAKEHLAKKTPEDIAIAKDIIAHLISSVEALEAHHDHL